MTGEGCSAAPLDDRRRTTPEGAWRRAGLPGKWCPRGTPENPTGSGRPSRNGKYRGEEGFTLLEIMVVIVILGLLIGLVAPAVLRQLGSAKTSIARQSLVQLGSVLDLYKLDAGSYPTTSEGLQALLSAPADAPNWSGPYVQGGKMPLDPWGHDYIYRDPSTRSGHDYDLCSRGPAAQAADDGPGLLCNN